MYVCSYDLHYNVLWGRYASELKGLTKKLLFSILPRKKNFHAKLQVHCAMVFECYSSCIVMYVHHYNVLLELMMSVLQEINSLYFPGGSPVSMVNCLHALPVLT